MARLPRLVVPGYPHHVIQRGIDRQAIVRTATDHEALRGFIVEEARAAGVALHAYVLMPNHFHLLVTPAQEGALARMMQSIGRRHVRHFNVQAQRSGTLWEGRYRCAVLQPEAFLLAAMAYLDLNPVRAGLAESAADYPWSSHRHCIGQAVDKGLSPHPLYWALGNTPFAREQAYADLVARGLVAELVRRLTDSGLHGWALGDEAFLAGLQKQTPRRVLKGRPGRPPTQAAL
ncbi:MAG: transposase [Ramlibacter sp.]|jgi:putative transposase